RSADGRREQIIAANVDKLAAVFSVAEPEPDYELLDRFLLLAESNEIPVFLVVNKLDLSCLESASEGFGIYEAAGYEVVYTSAVQGLGVDSLCERLADHITLFVGPSGVGKSSLLNAAQPGLGIRVGEVSRALQAGRHTTVAASLHPLDVGGYVVDTPGLRQLRFWEVEHRDLGWCFPEFRAHMGECRFPDCAHDKEPDCAIRQAVDAGSIAPSRYKSYLTIRRESEAAQSY
ncbi:MAG: ribosome small subunit-dependent GTPase A, partial [Acidimicrobiia bacterium]